MSLTQGISKILKPFQKVMILASKGEKEKRRVISVRGRTHVCVCLNVKEI